MSCAEPKGAFRLPKDADGLKGARSRGERMAVRLHAGGLSVWPVAG